MSKKLFSLMIVVGLAAVLGAFVGNANAEIVYLYDFSRVSPTENSGKLNGQHGWLAASSQTGLTNGVSSGATGWTDQGNYVQGISPGQASTSFRTNDGPEVENGWSYKLVDNVRFDFSCVVRASSTSYTSFGGLANPDGGATRKNLAVGVNAGKLFWAFNGVGYNTLAVPAGENKILIGLTFNPVAGSPNVYSVDRWWQNLTTGGSVTTEGSAVTYDFNNVGDQVVPISVHWDKISADTRSIGARVDDIRISVAIPEPSTLALLATGLIGLLAYAWRKRK